MLGEGREWTGVLGGGRSARGGERVDGSARGREEC